MKHSSSLAVFSAFVWLIHETSAFPMEANLRHAEPNLRNHLGIAKTSQLWRTTNARLGSWSGWSLFRFWKPFWAIWKRMRQRNESMEFKWWGFASGSRIRQRSIEDGAFIRTSSFQRNSGRAEGKKLWDTGLEGLGYSLLELAGNGKIALARTRISCKDGYVKTERQTKFGIPWNDQTMIYLIWREYSENAKQFI